jgi:hypothetical protein
MYRKEYRYELKCHFNNFDYHLQCYVLILLRIRILGYKIYILVTFLVYSTVGMYFK